MKINENKFVKFKFNTAVLRKTLCALNYNNITPLKFIDPIYKRIKTSK